MKKQFLKDGNPFHTAPCLLQTYNNINKETEKWNKNKQNEPQNHCCTSLKREKFISILFKKSVNKIDNSRHWARAFIVCQISSLQQLSTMNNNREQGAQVVVYRNSSCIFLVLIVNERRALILWNLSFKLISSNFFLWLKY